MQRREQSQSDNGARGLLEYLQDYRRITLTYACETFVKLDDVTIGVWVNRNGQWRQDTKAERRLRQLDIKDESLCSSIITKLYGLSQAEYEKIKNSFDEGLWKSWAGIYQSIEDERRPNFVFVVKLPDKAKIGTRGAAGLGAGLGATAGLITGIAGTRYNASRTAAGLVAKQNDAMRQVEGELATARDTHAAAMKLVQGELATARETNLASQGQHATTLDELKRSQENYLAAIEHATDLNQDNQKLEQENRNLKLWRDLLPSLFRQFRGSNSELDRVEKQAKREIKQKGLIYNFSDEDIEAINPDILSEEYQSQYKSELFDSEDFKDEDTEALWTNFFRSYILAVLRSNTKRKGAQVEEFRRERDRNMNFDVSSPATRDEKFRQFTRDYFSNKIPALDFFP
jgi:hypothetical protein